MEDKRIEYSPKDLKRPIDPDKAVALVNRLRANLNFEPIQYHDPIYGDQPPHRFYPSGLLIDCEDIVNCGVGEFPPRKNRGASI